MPCRTIHRTGLQVLTCLLLFIPGPLPAATASHSFTFDTANELMAAVGKLQLTTARLRQSLAYCPATFPHLQESARNAGLEWQKRNEAILSQAILITNAVISSVKHNASAFVAEKMALEMESVVAQSVQQSSNEFTAKSRKEQHYLCNRLILSIAAGERDLQQLHPAATQRVMGFKQ